MNTKDLHDALTGYLDRVPLVEMVGWSVCVDLAKLDVSGSAYRVLGHLIEHVAAQDQLPALIAAVQKHYPRAPQPVVVPWREAVALRDALAARWPTVPEALCIAGQLVRRDALPSGAHLSANELWFYAIVEACKHDRFDAFVALAAREPV
jgi:hypothetical protein